MTVWVVMPIVCVVLSGCAATRLSVTPDAVHDGALDKPLTTTPGDPLRGRQLIVTREANCLLCHALPETGERFMGNVAPSLSHIASRLTPAQIRLRIADPTRLNPSIAMPAYYRTAGLDEVAEGYRGKPILTAQQVEDVVAYLATMH